MRKEFKNTAKNNSIDFEKHLGDLLNKTWEVIRVSSLVIDKCLQVESVSDNAKYIHLLMMSRNLLSDCCCCLDALERGHDRTISNNLRMILEDLSCIMEASENEKVYADLLKGKHQASQSISFVDKLYPGQDLKLSYGKLSKISHHKSDGLFVRQWINQHGLLSHVKPFDPNQCQPQLEMLLMIIHFARLAGEVAEKLCIDKLEAPYFWTKQKNRNPSPEINITMCEIAEKIAEKFQQLRTTVE